MLNSFASGIRRIVGGAVNDVSPIRLFNMQQARKLGDNLAGHGMPRAPSMGIRRARTFRANTTTGEQMKSWWNGMYQGDSVGAYAKRSAGGTLSPIYQRQIQRRATTRRATAGILGAATVGGMVFGGDSAVSQGGAAGATVGGVAIAAGGVAELGARMGSPGAGGIGAAGILGWSAMNMYRSGNNFGPF